MKKRIFAGLVAAVLMLSACGGNDSGVEQNAFEFNGYPVNTEQEITYWMSMNPNITALYSNFGETPFAKELEKRTGIKVNYVHPAVGQDAQSLSLMIASDEMTDLIEYSWGSYQGGPGSSIANETIVPLNDMYKAPVGEEFQKYWNIPVFMENDANAAAFGEYIASGEKSRVFVAVTLGTGVGGGVVIDGKLFKGFNGAGAELGHSVIVFDGNLCTCGNKGCLETYASATALISQTEEAMKEHPESLMHALAKEYGKVNGRVPYDAAKQGDEAAKEVVETYGKYVAAGILSFVNIFQPDKVVIGGGVSNQGEYLINPVREHVKKYDFNRYFEKVKIETATLKNDAGIVGAAMIARGV